MRGTPDTHSRHKQASLIHSGASENGDASLLKSFNAVYAATYLPSPKTGAHFAADSIISSAEAEIHVHLAEGLGVPLTLFSSEYISDIISS